MNFKEFFNICEEADLDFQEGKYGPLKNLIGKKTLRMYGKELKNVMPAGKVAHSINVAKNVARSGGGIDAVSAAMFHDFLERGGDIHAIAVRLGFSPHVIQIIDSLSNEEKYEGESTGNAPLEHIRAVLGDPSLPRDTKNLIILIKLADRIDNLNRRVSSGGIGKGYLRKSKELAMFLFANYSGSADPMLVLRQKLKNVGVKIKKSMISSYGGRVSVA